MKCSGRFCSKMIRPLFYSFMINRKQSRKICNCRLTNTIPEISDRVRFLERMPAEKYLGLVKTVDVILDTFYYTGGANTNYDAFAAGTPVVTWPSDMHRGRYTCAAYQQMGYMDLVAESRDDYVNKAIALASDKTLASKGQSGGARRL